jgi:protoheme IX farnesyltransferase
MKNYLSYLELCKIKISLFSALSAATGYILVSGELTATILIPVMGVFFLACGAGTLNQYQEKNIDAQMIRTQSRPIPSGRIETQHAFYYAALLLTTGFLILFFLGNFAVLGLAVFALLWYNLIYTYLKRITAFAAVPGAVTGAIPPAIGWVSGGGQLTDHGLLAICFFFFMWQVPHFWLLLLSYDKDFRQAGLPAINKLFSSKQLTKISITWILAAATASLLIPFYGTSTSNVGNLLLFAVAVWLAWNGLKVYRQREGQFIYLSTFKKINIYMILVMLVLNLNSLLQL